MLKPWPHNQIEQDMSSLVSSRNALRFLYDESIGLGNADITLILREALRCSDRLIAEGQEISYESRDALFYLYFLKAILGLHHEKIRHLVALLEWLEIIPRKNQELEAATPGSDREPKSTGIQNN
jgi:hypothetical protein